MQVWVHRPWMCVLHAAQVAPGVLPRACASSDAGVLPRVRHATSFDAIASFGVWQPRLGDRYQQALVEAQRALHQRHALIRPIGRLDRRSGAFARSLSA